MAKMGTNVPDRDIETRKAQARGRFETLQGKLIPVKGALRTRYLRFYSRGSNSTAWNNYQEIEVYGQPGKKQ